MSIISSDFNSDLSVRRDEASEIVHKIKNMTRARFTKPDVASWSNRHSIPLFGLIRIYLQPVQITVTCITFISMVDHPLAILDYKLKAYWCCYLRLGTMAHGFGGPDLLFFGSKRSRLPQLTHWPATQYG
jgi:hypothetical protein